MNRYNSSIVKSLFYISECHLDDLQNALSDIIPCTVMAQNIAKTYSYIESHKAGLPTPNDIREVHRLTYTHIDRFAGSYRQEGEFCRKIHQLLDVWCQNWVVGQKKENSMSRYYEFLAMKPFTDGNVLTGRLLLVWDLMYNKNRSDSIKKQVSIFRPQCP